LILRRMILAAFFLGEGFFFLADFMAGLGVWGK
jgi:hypothetical protein